MSSQSSKDAEATKYLDHRRLLITEELDQSRFYDRSALTVASGALGLSFAVIGDLVKGTGPIAVPALLWTGWFALVLCILSTLFSVRFSVRAWKQSVISLDAQYSEGKPPVANAWSPWVELLNWLSAAFLFAGLLSLTIFGAANLTNEETKMSGTPAKEQRGSTPPRPPAGTPNGGSTPPAAPATAPKSPPPPPPQK